MLIYKEFLSKRHCQTQAESLWQLCSYCHTSQYLQVGRSTTSVFPQQAGVFFICGPDSVDVEL